MTGRGGVPATGVSAVVLNVTATEPTAVSFLTAFPGGAARPLASSLNYSAGMTVPNPNLVTVIVSPTGAVDMYTNAGAVYLIADVAGWYGPEGGAVGALSSPVIPARVLDTRSGVGAAGRVGAGAQLSLQVTGRGGIPGSGVSAVVLNVTVTEPTAVSFLTAWPAGEARPLASNLNYVPGQTVPNLVAVKVGEGGRVNLYNDLGSVHVVADMAGWYGI